MNQSRSESAQLALGAVERKGSSPSVWVLDDEIHRGWNARLIRFRKGAYLLGLLVSDIRFNPPVLMLLIKGQARERASYETRALEEIDPALAMAAIEGWEAEIVAGRPGKVLSREWLRTPGTEAWSSVKDLLQILQSRDLLTGEYRGHGDD